MVTPLFQFRAWGQQLPYHWSTISNEAAFGTDYFTRTAVARSNILVNAPNETKYFYQDLDAAGARLNGRNRYTVTFPKGLMPPVNGFWSLTLYNQRHFFAPNAVGRYSFGTKTKDLKYNPDGSLTIYVQADPPRRRAVGQLAAGAEGCRRSDRRLLALYPRLWAEARRHSKAPGRRRRSRSSTRMSHRAAAGRPATAARHAARGRSAAAGAPSPHRRRSGPGR